MAGQRASISAVHPSSSGEVPDQRVDIEQARSPRVTGPLGEVRVNSFAVSSSPLAGRQGGPIDTQAHLQILSRAGWAGTRAPFTV
jgi:hypothetical protein